ncbi:MAG: hypothetical protein FRX48_00161 [Lasallia pustulata]|uniref:PinX1-related protein 1 n=1 Tax=Lasallia pustulata TaxID=136370 RepID=A0A5M8Q006_9LECA|nr:MAG: hypothetical protein FRX48_00161 [Lasallia pustulata]
MGLADSRKRAKLSHDPNNTLWSRSTTNFGHKILTAQGWTPGDYLGIQDAPHARLHTEANASHIRVALREDNLGLGAKRKSGQSDGQCTGLDAFQDLLGRLNGKTEVDLEKEQKSRDDLKRAIYTGNRWGSVRFVSGGLLVGDEIQKLADDEANRLQSSVLTKSDGRAGISLHLKKDEGAKKTALETKPVNAPDKILSSRRVRRRIPLESEGPDHPSPVSAEDSEADDCNEPKGCIHSPVEIQSLHAALENLGSKPSDPGKTQRKADRKRRKQGMELRRAAKMCRRAQESNEDTAKGAQESLHVESLDTSLVILPSVAQPETTRHRSESIIVGGRHAVRQRYIQHKKMAMMDSKALNEILMIKS